MHHLWKKVIVNTRCHEEKRCLRRVGVSEPADESCHWPPLELIVAAFNLWAVTVDADKMKEKRRRLRRRRVGSPLPRRQKIF